MRIRVPYGVDPEDLPDAEELARDAYEIEQEAKAARVPQPREDRDG